MYCFVYLGYHDSNEAVDFQIRRHSMRHKRINNLIDESQSNKEYLYSNVDVLPYAALITLSGLLLCCCLIIGVTICAGSYFFFKK